MTQKHQLTASEAVAIDYNTQRERLVMPEYGRGVQEMVAHAKQLADREERQRCAYTIVRLMASMTQASGSPEDIRQKLWNHLAAIANYELDIDYPVEIERLADTRAAHETVPYPQKPIRRRHYGAILEDLTKILPTLEDEEARQELASRIANQMKRDLARWNRDAMNEQRILDDLTNMTEGGYITEASDVRFQSDKDILSSVQQMMPAKKKKKK